MAQGMRYCPAQAQIIDRPFFSPFHQAANSFHLSFASLAEDNPSVAGL
jgi:hypothetical protein